MSARDTHHEAIKNALIKDGWKILRDPSFFLQKAIQTIQNETQLMLIVVNLKKEEIVQWIN